MLKVIFSNKECFMIQDRFIDELIVEGAKECFKQVGGRKSWYKHCDYMMVEFKLNKDINVDGLKDKDLIKRLDERFDIVIFEIDGITYKVPYFGGDANIWQEVEYLQNGNIRIVIDGVGA